MLRVKWRSEVCPEAKKRRWQSWPFCGKKTTTMGPVREGGWTCVWGPKSTLQPPSQEEQRPRRTPTGWGWWTMLPPTWHRCCCFGWACVRVFESTFARVYGLVRRSVSQSSPQSSSIVSHVSPIHPKRANVLVLSIVRLFRDNTTTTTKSKEWEQRLFQTQLHLLSRRRKNVSEVEEDHPCSRRSHPLCCHCYCYCCLDC